MGYFTSRTHFALYVFTSTDQSICEENAGAVTARACMQSVAYAQDINGVWNSPGPARGKVWLARPSHLTA